MSRMFHCRPLKMSSGETWNIPKMIMNEDKLNYFVVYQHIPKSTS